MAVVPRVLLDHVQQHLAKSEVLSSRFVRADRKSRPPSRGPARCCVATRSMASSMIRRRLSGSSSDRRVQLPVRVGVPVDRRPRLGRVAPTRHVGEPACSMRARCLSSPPRVRLEARAVCASCSAVEALGLQTEGVAVEVQEGEQGRGLVGGERRVGALVVMAGTSRPDSVLRASIIRLPFWPPRAHWVRCRHRANGSRSSSRRSSSSRSRAPACSSPSVAP